MTQLAANESSNAATVTSAGQRILTYLRQLPLPESERLRIAGDIIDKVEASKTADPLGEAFRLLHDTVDIRGFSGKEDLAICMPVHRSHMVPENLFRKKGKTPPRIDPADGSLKVPVKNKAKTGREFLNQPWGKIAKRRRLMMISLIVFTAAPAVMTMGSVLPHKGNTPLELTILIFFSALFSWVSIGFWTALAGFYTLMRHTDRVTVTHDMDLNDAKPRTNVRTAILFPVCKEDMDRVMAGVKATYLSLKRTGRLSGYDFHILSDTRDPDAWIDEENAWKRTRDELSAKGKLYYRRRGVNLKRKSGNIADFCRRYGTDYTYMIVMDADSVMSGRTINRMVSIMERKRSVGLLQTAPAVVGRQTLFARVQQFANRVYGPMFAAGLHFMQLGDAQYWGHNAIIRIRPFMAHCALPPLSGKPPLGGDILSHDFVEASLMRRAGWGVWLAFDLDGSYEESPPTLLDELKRDRRWCQGNIQHLRLLFIKGLFPAHRALFINGVMAYMSAFLWFAFLMLSSSEAIYEALAEPNYFPLGKSLFPTWPVWDPGWALSLLATTGILLFLPKVMSFLLIAIKGRASQFGGKLRLALSVLAEIILSTFLAPIRMLFHSKFVFAILIGMEAGWGSQQRDDRGTPWSDAFRFHLKGTLLAMVWGGLLFVYNRSFFFWITPILIPLLLAIPISVMISRKSTGLAARRAGLFLTPEETAPPVELTELASFHHEYEQQPRPLAIAKGSGFVRSVIEPAAMLFRLSVIDRPGRKQLPESIKKARLSLVEKALTSGPDSLNRFEKNAILSDPGTLQTMHNKVWNLPTDVLRSKWGLALN